ncbi:Protein NEOXANTHIN-DEFICIENT 1 [Rhynchospora pubera]|uniref:Protein NEOXANTHIN-DEFICIENT 1 n=1 Tax=Rhynchospora pubera TaxID=906938 RepID=A0AAV8EU91_9POAL|nr:Protein NEOXANTHIN-DEFICIENT 1 [Rhynchospora pubera]
MKVKERSSRYHFGPPWLFRGSALYQLHLVKAEIARAFIPKELKLVEAFGYTLGGFFLAQYEDSPAGKFDELVVIAGIVWNPPSSCAWAARVLVNSDDACHHGRKEVGLPSHIATFSKKIVTVTEKPNRSQSFLNRIFMNSTFANQMEHSEIEVSQAKRSSIIPFCNISLPFSVTKSENGDKGMMPKIRMSLPSFSGQTEDYPHLLKYSCEIECRVSAVPPAKVNSSIVEKESQRSFGNKTYGNSDILSDEEAEKRSILVLLSKPILALKFSFLKMWVGAPSIVVPMSRKKEVRFSST